MSDRDLPKGQWRCYLCKQEFCTPLSCLNELKRIREQEMSVVSAHDTVDSLEGEGQMKDRRGEDMDATRKVKVVAEDQRRVQADKAATLGACDECKRTNGQHDQKCSYNIANLI